MRPRVGITRIYSPDTFTLCKDTSGRVSKIAHLTPRLTRFLRLLHPRAPSPACSYLPSLNRTAGNQGISGHRNRHISELPQMVCAMAHAGRKLSLPPTYRIHLSVGAMGLGWVASLGRAVPNWHQRKRNWGKRIH